MNSFVWDSVPTLVLLLFFVSLDYKSVGVGRWPFRSSPPNLARAIGREYLPARYSDCCIVFFKCKMLQSKQKSPSSTDTRAVACVQLIEATFGPQGLHNHNITV